MQICYCLHLVLVAIFGEAWSPPPTVDGFGILSSIVMHMNRSPIRCSWMRIGISALAALLAVPSISRAQCQCTPAYRDAVRAANQANKQISLSPPLPMLNYDKGEHRITVKPAYIQGNLIDGTGDFSTISSDLNGFGGGISYSYSFADKWGVYLWGTGASVSGASVVTQGATTVELKGLKGSFGTLSAGIVRQFFGEKEGGFTLPVFIGPMLAKTKVSQTIFSTGFQADFDMEIDELLPGGLIGMEMGINISESFQLNPFLIGGVFGFTECHEYKVTALRNDAQGYSSESTCNGRPRQLLYPSWIMTSGLNVVYRPWGLAFNVTAPILKKNFWSGDDSAEFATFTFSKSFGNYRR